MYQYKVITESFNLSSSKLIEKTINEYAKDGLDVVKMFLE